MHKTLLVEVLEIDSNQYSKMVVQCQSSGLFYLLTIFPNWQGKIPKKGEIGYIEFECVTAGISEYFDKAEQVTKVFKNTYFIFYSFVAKKLTTTKKTLKC